MRLTLMIRVPVRYVSTTDRDARVRPALPFHLPVAAALSEAEATLRQGREADVTATRPKRIGIRA